MPLASLRDLGHLIPLRWRNRIRASLIRRAANKPLYRNSESGAGRSGSTELRSCRFCRSGETAHEMIGAVPITHHGQFRQNTYRLLLCSQCDVVYVDPDPPAEDLRSIYEDSEQFTDEHYSAQHNAQRITQSYGRRLDALQLVPDAGQTLVEIGAGLAWMSKACKQRRPTIRTIAQDISAECAATCPWVDDYRVGPLDTVLGDVSARLISLTHVVEHLPDPARVLTRLIDHLEPGGSIYIIAPYRPALWKPGDGLAPWLAYSYLHVPAHIGYLSRTWFERFAATSNLKISSWDQTHDAHQVFEVVLTKP